MSDIAVRPLAPTLPVHRLAPAIAVLGAAWNLFGVVQFTDHVRKTAESFERMGLTPERARVLADSPLWLHAGFAIGAFGGLAGCLLLLAHRRAAVPVLAASLAGYVVLFIGDVTEGVFAALGVSQVAILTTVVAIAIGLFAWSRRLAPVLR